MSRPRPPKRRVLGVVLSAVFVLAMVMGCGPGLYLINPDPAEPSATFTVLGMPVVYVWAVFWFGVQAGVVLVAYFMLWDAGGRRDS